MKWIIPLIISFLSSVIFAQTNKLAPISSSKPTHAIYVGDTVEHKFVDDLYRSYGSNYYVKVEHKYSVNKKGEKIVVEIPLAERYIINIAEYEYAKLKDSSKKEILSLFLFGQSTIIDGWGERAISLGVIDDGVLMQHERYQSSPGEVGYRTETIRKFIILSHHEFVTKYWKETLTPRKYYLLREGTKTIANGDLMQTYSTYYLLRPCTKEEFVYHVRENMVFVKWQRVAEETTKTFDSDDIVHRGERWYLAVRIRSPKDWYQVELNNKKKLISDLGLLRMYLDAKRIDKAKEILDTMLKIDASADEVKEAQGLLNAAILSTSQPTTKLSEQEVSSD